MVEIILFHHAGGLTPGVVEFADVLRGAGHVVHTPDLFDGRTFADVADGVAFAQERGEDAFAAKATEVTATLPADVVYVGMSMGCARAAEQLLTRPGARGALLLYGAVAPSWWPQPWPAELPAQAHVTAEDPWREPEAEEGFAAVGEVFVYPGSGHLFLERGHTDYDEATARLVTKRALAFLEELSLEGLS